MLVPALGIEPSSTALQTAAMTTSAKLALAGPTGIEPITSRSKREMISISPRTDKENPKRVLCSQRFGTC
jgi:hypothetical protein